MGRIVAITNLKGGIGKTTTVVNVSAGLALKGARVLVVDVDAQGNLAMALGVNPKHTLYEAIVDGTDIARCITSARPNLDIIPADESLLGAQPILARRPDWSRVLEQVLRPIKQDYDFILIDCGGSMTVLNINALIAASDVVVPTTVEHLSVKGLEKLFKQVMGVKGGTNYIRLIVPTMFDSRLRQSHALLEQLRATYGDLVAAPIRVNVRLSESSSAGHTIYEYDRRSRGALDYAQLVEHLSTLWNFHPAVPASPAQDHKNNRARANGAPPPSPIPLASVPVTEPSTPPVVPHAATPLSRPESPSPVVAGAGAILQNTCPNCGHPLNRATVAGYRVVYCDHCKYKQQELVSERRA